MQIYVEKEEKIYIDKVFLFLSFLTFPIQLGQFSYYAKHQSVFKSLWQILIYVSEVEIRIVMVERNELNHIVALYPHHLFQLMADKSGGHFATGLKLS